MRVALLHTTYVVSIRSNNDGLAWLTSYFNAAFLSGEFTPLMRCVWCSCNTLALPKKVAVAPAARPISIGDSLSRICGRAAMLLMKDEMNAHSGTLQLG